MASREREDAMAGLLKRSLAGDADSANDCPAPDILAAYFERSLDREEEAAIELHFSKCARCREQFAALGRAEQAADAQAAPATAKAARASWLWDWRWLAPAVAVLVITAIWATRRPALTQIAEHAAATHAPAQSVAPDKGPSRTATRQAPEPTDRVAPRKATALPGGPPQTLQSAPGFSAGTANGVGVPSASVEKSETPNLVAPKAESLPLSGRNYSEIKTLPEAPSAAKATADQAANAPAPAGTTESVTVESAAPPVTTPEPAPSQAGNGVVGGVAGGVVSGTTGAQARTSNAKQALVRAYRDRSEITVANQAGALTPANVIRTPDPSILWRVASGGFVERSEDGGRTWKGQLPNQTAHFTAGSAPGAKICWLVGDNGIILVTEDASNWTTIPSPADADFVGVVARDASSATVTTDDGRKFTTTNRGKIWKLVK